MSFPKSKRRTAWETFLTVLKQDPILGREVKSFRTWRGDTRTTGSKTSRQYPYLLMEAQCEESEWEDTATISADFMVDVEIAMNGTDPADLMDFWGAIQRAIFPTDKQANALIEQRLRNVGIYKVTLQHASFGVVDTEAEGGAILMGQGKIKLTYDEQLKGF